MRILFTGASSFTGYWFVRELIRAGHQVVPTLRRSREAYDGVRRIRVDGLWDLCDQVVEECSFGDDTFRHLITDGEWALVCHHGAETASYRSREFDAIEALRANCRSVRTVFDELARVGCRRLIVTGSVFEADEGESDTDERPAFSPYGLSKTLTYQTFRYYARQAGLHLGKFVIPNPFGPLEEPRFTAYLLTTWLSGKVPLVRTPEYVRDNIHVSLLARAYSAFAAQLSEDPGLTRFNPSGYRESQGAFAARVAREMERRLGRPCTVEFSKQTDFSEPRVRLNTDELDGSKLGWEESSSWDDLARFYLDRA